MKEWFKKSAAEIVLNALALAAAVLVIAILNHHGFF